MSIILQQSSVHAVKDPKPTLMSTKAMRKRNAAIPALGYKTSTVSLSPKSLKVVDGIRTKFNLRSREAATTTVLERIDQEEFLRQEFLTINS